LPACQTEGGAVISLQKLKPAVLLFFILSVSLSGQESRGLRTRADELLRENKPAEALPLYISAKEQNPRDPDIYRNLGYVYELLGDYENAVKTYQQGSTVASLDKDIFYNAMGRCLFRLERFSEAEVQYDKALDYNPSNYAVYVNRANVRVELREYQKAINDYSSYLSLERSPQQETEIRKMLGLLQGILEEEKARIAAEEAQRREEEARQKALLDSVLSSLDDVGKETQSLSAGAEAIEEPDIIIDLVD